MHSSVHSSLFTISNTWKQLKRPSTEERIKKIYLSIHVHIVVQLLSPVWLLWPCELQHTRLPCPSLSPWGGSNSFPVMPSSHLILCRPLHLLPSIFLSIKIFSNESVIPTRLPKYLTFSFSISFPMNNQGLFPLGLTGMISLLSWALYRIFSSTTVQKQQFLALKFLYSPTFTSIHDYWKNHSFD